ncbi:LysR family transcriptional regulator [uncultured Parasutterella sp.]|uniref:LysR family transcriptional regulator n=1 Tax=uncultured Parasutterella sp. TaxID=1263098 RepID=UPI0025B64E3E|nr:LysR family transcriptional regulator [uncultured Parasutterella sp.]
MAKETNLDIPSLRIFLETAKDCNMTRAADTLGISQPAVSAAIKKIENKLGSALFDRDRRPMQLTTAGRLLWNRAFLILEQLDDLARSVQNSIEGKKPDVRLGFSDCMGACVSPLLMNDLLEITENLSGKCGSTPFVSSLLRQKKIDIALSSDPMEDLDETHAIHFLTERFLFILPKPLAERRKILCTQDLISAVGNLPYLRFGKETFDFVQSERIYRSLHFMDTRRIEVDTNFAMINLIALGKGWSILPPLSMWMAREYIDKVEFIRLTNEATRRYYVLYNDPVFEIISRKIYRFICQIFKKEILPEMEKVCPALLEHIQLHEGTI